MALIEFKDLPDTTTPLTADNLNNNFNELSVSIAELKNKTIYAYDLTPVSSSLSANSWVALASDKTTDTLPAGKYLAMYCGNITSSNSTVSIATLNPYMDGSRIYSASRTTIPVSSAVTVSGQCVWLCDFETDSTHTVNLYVYGTATTSVNSVNVYFIKID